MRFLLAALLGLFPLVAGAAATTAQLLTPRYTSVAGGESQVMQVKFFNSDGTPAAGERAFFGNDICGFFQNGEFSIGVTTDSQGVATVTFTAMNPPGITCWVSAASGQARAVIDVLTYRFSAAYVTASLDPERPHTGQPFRIRAQAKAGAYNLANVELTATIVPGSASASISPPTAKSGDSGTVTFGVNPDGRIGAYDVEIDFRGHKTRVRVPAPENPYQDMWWSGSAENGWGVSVVQHGDMLFTVIYAYDAQGKPTWYAVPGGTWNAARTGFTGDVYSPQGSPFFAYDASRFAPGAAIGTVTLAFTGANTATLDYRIDGVTGRKSITRQLSGPNDASLPEQRGDMWWGGPSQDGWGIAVLQQYRSLFSVWFTYDAGGQPTWYVMPSGGWVDGNTWQGRIYRATGSPWLGQAYDPAALELTDVGSYQMVFDAAGASFRYYVEGRGGTLALTRQPF
jgi:hypothetical protein